MVNKSKGINRGRNVVFFEKNICSNDLLVLFEWLEPLKPSRKIAAWHGCEICYVLEGYVIHVFEEKDDTNEKSEKDGNRTEVKISEGEISLLNYMQTHHVIPSPTGKFISYNFNVEDKNIPKEQAFNLFSAPKISASVISNEIKNYSFLNDIEAWLRGKKNLPQEEVDDYFLNTLATILDCQSPKDQTSAQDQLPRDDSHWLEIRSEIEKNFSRNFSVDELATLAGLSKFHFIRRFKRQFGCTPIEYLHFVRLNRAMHLLLTGTKNVEDVAYEVGFNDVSFFVHKFKDFYGKPPSLIKRATSPIA